MHTERKGRRREKNSLFHHFWAKDVWGIWEKFIQHVPKNITYLCCMLGMMVHTVTYTDVKRQSGKETTKAKALSHRYYLYPCFLYVQTETKWVWTHKQIGERLLVFLSLLVTTWYNSKNWRNTLCFLNDLILLWILAKSVLLKVFFLS